MQEYVGGYEDWLRQTGLAGKSQRLVGKTKDASGSAKNASGSKAKTKRSFKEEREYAELPDRIAALEAEQQQLQAAIADPEFYKKPAADIHAALERVDARSKVSCWRPWSDGTRSTRSESPRTLLIASI